MRAKPFSSQWEKLFGKFNKNIRIQIYDTYICLYVVEKSIVFDAGKIRERF